MIAPPKELWGFVEVEPEKGFVLKDNAPDDVRKCFEKWIVEIEQDINEAAAVGIIF